MATVQGPSAPSASDDLPPPYSAVVGNPQYGFVAPGPDPYAPYGPPKQFTTPHPYPVAPTVTSVQPQTGDPHLSTGMPSGVPMSVGIVVPQAAVGNEPTTVTCFNCGKVVTTRVTYTTAWHTHLVAGSLCIITM